MNTFEYETDREASKVLGKSSSSILSDSNPSIGFMTVSYWQSIEHLQAFALGETHRKGWDWWRKMVKEYPHIGLSHEVYGAQKGYWENMYENSVPIGMGK